MFFHAMVTSEILDYLAFRNILFQTNGQKILELLSVYFIAFYLFTIHVKFFSSLQPHLHTPNVTPICILKVLLVNHFLKTMSVC